MQQQPPRFRRTPPSGAAERGGQTSGPAMYARLVATVTARRAAMNLTPTPEPTHDPTCPICCDRGWIVYDRKVDDPLFGRAELCPAPKCETVRTMIQQRVDRTFAKSPILDEYQQLTRKSFAERVGGDLRGKEDAIDAMEAFAAGGTDGVVFSGDYGRGKTGLAALCLIERAAVGDLVTAIDYRDFVGRVQETYGVSGGPSRNELIDAIAAVDVLLIDELGSLRQAVSGATETPNKTEILEQLIRYRHARRLRTIITTNLDADQFNRYFGEYIYQRVVQRSVWVHVGGLSLRFES